MAEEKKQSLDKDQDNTPQSLPEEMFKRATVVENLDVSKKEKRPDVTPEMIPPDYSKKNSGTSKQVSDAQEKSE